MQHHKRGLKASLQPLYEPFSETGGVPPFDFKRVNGVYFSLFSTRFVREEACVIHP